ncbi:hypothetical protein [Mariniflexile sp.]|uniref:hypothetical protein n=1 Tax=Mariniflexile sp. TaxID=1979402 RepID=UPI0040489A42
MKSKILIPLLFLIASNSFSQNINWRNLTNEQKHIISLNVGLLHGATIGVGYGYQLNTKLPIILNAEFSIPFGEILFDDFKTKIGAQAEILKIGGFSTTVKAYGVFRRFENDNARLLNFGSEFSAVSGYYKHNWYVAGEFGFDKAIVTHIKHSDIMRDYYPEIKNGWYIPTGGNFFYGIQSGLSFGRNDLNLKIGSLITQDFKTTPNFPYYLQFGINRKL